MGLRFHHHPPGDPNAEDCCLPACPHGNQVRQLDPFRAADVKCSGRNEPAELTDHPPAWSGQTFVFFELRGHVILFSPWSLVALRQELARSGRCWVNTVKTCSAKPEPASE